ncbi:hypothetical protein R1sor_019391 [Riccia sorocarpa]|uniref:Uncharacterized protein n=1 Tax=Riccia sorocarpa TaxID=122646 RepID=A0ABD3IFQ2_9MARC
MSADTGRRLIHFAITSKIWQSQGGIGEEQELAMGRRPRLDGMDQTNCFLEQIAESQARSLRTSLDKAVDTSARRFLMDRQVEEARSDRRHPTHEAMAVEVYPPEILHMLPDHENERIRRIMPTV